MARDESLAWKPFEKISVTEKLCDFEPYDRLSGSVQETIEYLQKVMEHAKAKGLDNVRFWYEQNYEDVQITIYANRMETDAEFNARWEAHKERLEQKKRRQQRQAENAAKKLKKTEDEQRALYEELKRKFG